MQTFGELTPENAHYRKYAKMKAAYIHNCLKNGETPVAGPLVDDEEEAEDSTEIPEDSHPPSDNTQTVPAAAPSAPAVAPSAPAPSAPAGSMSTMSISSPR